MPELWIALTGLIILFLFWRQLAVLKLQGKIDYAPLVLTVGAISSVCLFLFSSHESELKSDIQDALMPMLIALIFYLVMYLLVQFKTNSIKAKQAEQEKLLLRMGSTIEEHLLLLDEKLSAIASTDEKTFDAVQLALKNEFSVFRQLSLQQEKLSQKLEEMYVQEESALINIQKFISKDIVDLDAVVHRHIDLLRIAEQEHFNKLHTLLNEISEGSAQKQYKELLASVKEHLYSVEQTVQSSVAEITDEAKEQLKGTAQKMAGGLENSKQLSETLMLSLQEYEMKMQELNKQGSKLLQKSDTIHESMEDTYAQSQKIRPVYASLNELVSRLMDIYTEYKHAKKELHVLASELGNAEERHFEIMDKKIDALGEDMHAKIDASLKELQTHYHFAENEVSSTVKTLSAKAQLKKSYSEE
ncbi:MAG: hypothetical protein IBX43_06415 [Campylobacterales bacterium]|nr:hypothetical protein [Campylobacterales bacterium]